jgi:uncharacterized protein YbaA (DUF1428 family)
MKTNSKKYIDGFVIPIKKKNLPAYKKMAIDGAKMWKRLGALEYFECLADDLKSGEMMGMGFKKMAGLKKDETMIFSFIVYKSKAHRDAVNKKDFEKAGSKPFQYTKGDGVGVSMNYWQIPDEILEHPEQAQIWAQKSILIPTKHSSKPRQF